MEYGSFSIDQLLDTLARESPVQVAWLRKNHARIQCGLLSVGVKLHVLADFPGFSQFLARLGGEHFDGHNRPYRHAHSVWCLVLPPVGSADAMVKLLECIERSTGVAVFNNPMVQIQVCTPGRLEAERAAMLSVAFYLGSDVLRRYKLEHLETTFSESKIFTGLRRGKRITIYDGEGWLRRDFEFWKLEKKSLKIAPQLPFTTDRTDVIACSTRIDVHNVNLVASLLVHAQHEGYWQPLGEAFARDLKDILDEHMLEGILHAPWIRTEDKTTHSDEEFFILLEELMSYAFEEQKRTSKRPTYLEAWFKRPGPPEILTQVKELIEEHRATVVHHTAIINMGYQQ